MDSTSLSPGFPLAPPPISVPTTTSKSPNKSSPLAVQLPEQTLSEPLKLDPARVSVIDSLNPLSPIQEKELDKGSRKENRDFLKEYDHVKKYSTISSIIARCFGQAMFIEGLGYVNARSLSEHVITKLTGDVDLGKKFNSRWSIQKKIQYFVEQHGGLQKFTAFLDEVSVQKREVNQTALAEAFPLKTRVSKRQTELDLIQTLDQLDVNRLKQIEWSNTPGEMERMLQPGDIIFFQDTNLATKKLSSRVIMRGQVLARLWMKGKVEPYAQTYTHVGMYIGDGKFAEAAPGKHGEDVKITQLHDKEMILKPGDKRRYRISRPQDPEMTRYAVDLAKRYAEDKENVKNQLKEPQSQVKPKQLKTKLSYSVAKAVFSIFGDANFSDKVKRHVLQQMVEITNEVENPNDSRGKPESYFCSQFVLECLQRGNAIQLLREIKKELKKEGGSIDDIPNIKGKNGLTETRNWINKVLKEHPNILEKLKMNFYPEYVSPQKFRSIIGANPDLFVDVATINPPLAQA